MPDARENREDPINRAPVLTFKPKRDIVDSNAHAFWVHGHVCSNWVGLPTMGKREWVNIIKGKPGTYSIIPCNTLQRSA